MAGPLTSPLHLHPCGQDQGLGLGPSSNWVPLALGPSSSQPAPASAPAPAPGRASAARSPATPSPSLASSTPSVSISSYDTAPLQSSFSSNPSASHRPLSSSSYCDARSSPAGAGAVVHRVGLPREASARTFRTVREASDVFAEAKQLYLNGMGAVERQRKGKGTEGTTENDDESPAGWFFKVSGEQATHKPDCSSSQPRLTSLTPSSARNSGTQCIYGNWRARTC